VISQNIIKVKEAVPAPPAVPLGPQQPNRMWHGRGNMQRYVVNTQLEYLQYLQNCSIKEGMFVVNKLRDTAIHRITDKTAPWWGFYYILNIEPEISQLPLHWDRNHPKAFRIFQLFPADDNHPVHIRWDSHLDFRPVTDEEYKTIIEPRYAQLQDRIAPYRSRLGPTARDSEQAHTSD
jgi:hypothetical protein